MVFGSEVSSYLAAGSRTAMKSIFDHTHQRLTVLKCTREWSLGFYRSLGFHTMEKVQLTDEEVPGPDGKVKIWVMV